MRERGRERARESERERLRGREREFINCFKRILYKIANLLSIIYLLTVFDKNFLHMNADIMKTQIYDEIKYDLKGYMIKVT